MKPRPLTTSDVKEFIRLFGEYMFKNVRTPTPALHAALLTIANDLYVENNFPPGDAPKDALGLARHKDALASYERRTTPAASDLFIDTLYNAFLVLVAHLPPHAFHTGPGLATCPLELEQKDVELLALAFETVRHLDLFAPLRKQLKTNRERIQETYKNKPYPPIELLRHTPLQRLLTVQIPFSIPLKTFREHGFMYAKSGHGKSASMRTLLADLIQQDCALFLIDGNGGLIKNLDKVQSIKDRLVVFDPDETPALNFFKMKVSQERQLELYFYLFQALDQSLTPSMATMVSYLVELMQRIPNATLDTLRQLCEQKDFAIEQYVSQLSERAQDYFKYQFHGKDQLVNQTKTLIARRLHGLNSYPKFLSMFNAPDNKFDAYQLMQEKKIVIVDTSRRKLGDAGSTILGRFILAQCLNAAWQRDEHDHLALIIVDEAKAYIDEHSKQFLSDTRFFNVGLFLATQYPDQFKDGVRAEINTNTSIKFAGPVAHQVASELYRDMRCTTDFIMDMSNRTRDNYPTPPYYAEWACYVANTTHRALKIKIPFGVLDDLPAMSAAEYQAFRAANKAKYAQSPPKEAKREDGNSPPLSNTPIVPPATTNHSQHKEEPRDTPQPPAAPRATPASPIEYDTDI